MNATSSQSAFQATANQPSENMPVIAIVGTISTKIRDALLECLPEESIISENHPMTMQSTLQNRDENAQRPAIWFIPTESDWEVGADNIKKYLKTHLPTAADTNSHIFSILDDSNPLDETLHEPDEGTKCAETIAHTTNKMVNLITLSALHEIIHLHVQEKQTTLNISQLENASYAFKFKPEETRTPSIPKKENNEIKELDTPLMR
ncbi:MAG: hypothetical protein IT559_02600 [Alphaproteobacteria bacterium]|nr:hypothetical protein [Alphaproteobacteria bacterium]